MKIIEVTNEFSMGNGRSVVIAEIASELAKYFECEIWYSYFVRGIQKVRNPKVKVIKIPQYKIFLRLLNVKEPTVVHTHFGKSFLSTSLAKIFNKNIIHIHTEYVNPPYKVLPNGNKWNYYKIKLLDKIAYKQINKAIGISKYACNEIKKCGVSVSKIVFIPVGVNYEYYQKINYKKIKKLRKRLKIKKSDFIFGCFSRFSPSKNIKFLIENADKFPGKLILAGAIDVNAKKYFKECLEMAKKNKKVKIVTNVKEEEKKDYYHLFNVFVYPSLWEGFGLPIVEALACGKPVICFHRFSMPELVKNYYNGFCVKSEKEFFEKVNLIYKNQKLRKKLEKNAKNFASNFDWEKIAKKYYDLINNLLIKK